MAKKPYSTVADGGPYLLGLDAGNTVIKAVLFDLEGRQLAAHAVDGATHKPAAGMVERSVPELWENAKAAIAGCIGAADIDPGAIAAIGTAGHGNGLYLLDPDGTALIGIQSLDTRAAALAVELDTAAGSDMHAIALQRPWPSQTPTLLAWLKRHRPELYERAGTLLFAKDILTYSLTGKPASEISDMSGAWVLLRLPDAVYDTGLLALYGLEDAMALLPPLLQPSDIVGVVTAEAAAATGLARGRPWSPAISTSSHQRSARGRLAPARHRWSWAPGRSIRFFPMRRLSTPRSLWLPALGRAVSSTWSRARRQRQISNGMCASWSSAGSITTIRSDSAMRSSAI